MSPRKYPDIQPGDRFGKWVVQYEVSTYRERRYSCICDCGSNRVVLARSLKANTSRSCGCARVVASPGERYGRLTVIERVPSSSGTRLTCNCDCGKTVVVSSGSVRSGRTSSCGCYHIEAARTSRLKHGFARRDSTAAEFNIWTSMIDRCTNMRNGAYDSYGGRGIRICNEWLCSFETFLADVGRRPSPKHSLDRKDNSSHYMPGNVRWATRSQQARNRRNTVMVTIGDQAKCLPDWVDEFNTSYEAVRRRLRRGWDPYDALSTPMRKTASKP